MAVPVFFCFVKGDWGLEGGVAGGSFFGVGGWIWGGLAVDWSIGLAVWRME